MLHGGWKRCLDWGKCSYYPGYSHRARGSDWWRVCGYKDVPPYAVMAGNPARLIKYRFDEKLIEGLLETRWWTLPHELVEKLPQHDVAMCVDILRQGNGT